MGEAVYKLKSWENNYRFGNTNATLQMDSNFSLENCSINLPELKVPIKDNITVSLDYNQSINIMELSNKSLSVAGMELRINKTEIPLRPGLLVIPEAWLIIPQNLLVKHVGLNPTNGTDKNKTSIVNGTLSLSNKNYNVGYYINIRNSTLVLPPNSLISEESIFQQGNTSLASWDTRNGAPIGTIIYYITNNFLRALVFLIGLLILYRIIVYLRNLPTSLVLKNFGKTGYDNVNKNLEGLSQLTREYLGTWVDDIQKIAEKHSKDQELGNYKVREFCPLPSDLKKKDISDFISSMKDAKLDSIPIFQPIINLSAPIANFLVPPRGVEVSCFLQSKGKNPEVLGLTFKVSDISEKQEPKSFTYWEKQKEPKDKDMDINDKIKSINKLIEYFKEAGELH